MTIKEHYTEEAIHTVRYVDVNSLPECRARARFDGALVFLLGCFTGAVSALAGSYLWGVL
jgi:hypothetical protein